MAAAATACACSVPIDLDTHKTALMCAARPPAQAPSCYAFDLTTRAGSSFGGVKAPVRQLPLPNLRFLIL